MEKNFAIVKNGIVENIVVWDGIKPYTPDGQLIEIVEGSFVNIGFLYQDGQFIDPNPPVIEETPSETPEV